MYTHTKKIITQYHFTHVHAHTRTHARMHACIHIHTHIGLASTHLKNGTILVARTSAVLNPWEYNITWAISCRSGFVIARLEGEAVKGGGGGGEGKGGDQGKGKILSANTEMELEKRNGQTDKQNTPPEELFEIVGQV